MDLTTIKLSFHISCVYYIILIVIVFPLISVWSSPPQHQDCWRRGCNGRVLALASQHSQHRIWGPFLWWESNQQRLGFVCSALLPESGSNPNEVLRTASVINHPDYYDPTHDNDIALLKLSSSVTFTNYIRPVCLAAAGSKYAAGTETWVTGWGALQSGGSSPDKLQEVMIPVVSSSDCDDAYGGGITSNMICAGLLNEGGKDSCQGDSGGPLVTRNGSLWIQSGVVSFGIGCADPRYPGVYARISQYQDWITSTIGSNLPGFVEFNNNGFRSAPNLLLIPISLTFSIIPFICSLYLSSLLYFY
uniref:Trypsin-like n=1 Tax=Sinocyclocheilus rhinocerous TaxID=307959 RepID=A0A673HBQ5_9TELE